MLYPGEAYSIFLNGANDVSFMYPAPGLARTEIDQASRDYYDACIAEHYEPVRTGISSPIIITDIDGYIKRLDNGKSNLLEEEIDIEEIVNRPDDKKLRKPKVIPVTHKEAV